MALDGIFLRQIKNEIEKEAVSMRVEKVHQPSKEELVLILRGRNGQKKLLLSSRANSPRIHFTSHAPENPKTPPMLCMLLRKHLTSAMITGFRQVDSDRILFIDFDSTNEIGDKVSLSLVIEIMAQHSNIILINSDNNIIDALKRVDLSTSSVRQILPGLTYALPPKQFKLDLFSENADKISDKILSFKNKNLSSAVLSTIEGISPIISREIAFRVSDTDEFCAELDEEKFSKLKTVIEEIQETINKGETAPYIVEDENGRPTDFAFMEIKQYGSVRKSVKEENFSALLDRFYYERDRLERTKQRSDDLYKKLNSLIQRISKKINLQTAELAQCADREALRINAELISANLYRLEKGVPYYEIENYYDENKIIRIKADPALSPNANSQKYFKEYRKAKTAEKMLTELIEKNREELQYIESVLDELNRADGEDEINEIRRELAENGYMKSKQKDTKNKAQKTLPPKKFISDDGFTILVGRNNIQNDKLSLKTARGNDMWLHTQKIHGSHVVIVSDGKEISDLAIEQAAIIAAYNSKARLSSQVPVDYTLAKNLKKPNGAKPGFVIYHVYNTLFVKPDEKLVEKLSR